MASHHQETLTHQDTHGKTGTKSCPNPPEQIGHPTNESGDRGQIPSV